MMMMKSIRMEKNLFCEDFANLNQWVYLQISVSIITPSFHKKFLLHLEALTIVTFAFARSQKGNCILHILD